MAISMGVITHVEALHPCACRYAEVYSLLNEGILLLNTLFAVLYVKSFPAAVRELEKTVITNSISTWKFSNSSATMAKKTSILHYYIGIACTVFHVVLGHGFCAPLAPELR